MTFVTHLQMLLMLKMKKLSDKHQNHSCPKKNKELDKNEAAMKADTGVCCFYLEEFVITPHSFESCLYCKRRLNTFNLTVYDLGTLDGHCFV